MECNWPKRNVHFGGCKTRGSEPSNSFKRVKGFILTLLGLYLALAHHFLSISQLISFRMVIYIL